MTVAEERLKRELDEFVFWRDIAVDCENARVRAGDRIIRRLLAEMEGRE